MAQAERLEDILAEFTDRIRAAVQAEMLATLQGTIGAPATRKAPAAKPAKLPPIFSKRRKGRKRDPMELKALTTQLLSAIKTGPGHRIEQLAKMLEVSTKDLALPAKKLIAAKQIKTTGNRRATKIFPQVK